MAQQKQCFLPTVTLSTKRSHSITPSIEGAVSKIFASFEYQCWWKVTS